MYIHIYIDLYITVDTSSGVKNKLKRHWYLPVAEQSKYGSTMSGLS